MHKVLDKGMFKDEQVRGEWDGIKPTLQDILSDMAAYCLLAQMPFVITDLTSTEAEDIKYKRKSVTHRQGRAADLRSTHWPEHFIEEFTEHFMEKYAKVAATNAKGKNVLIVRHVGTADHLHVQIRRNV